MPDTRPSGRLIAIEGLDGSGKTTQARRLADRLAALGVPALLTAEPTAGPIGRLIRDRIAGGSAEGHDPATLALLFAADRRDHVTREIAPAIRAGTWVVSDRYLLSSLAYQAVDLDLDWIAALNRAAPPADLTIYLRVAVRACLERLAGRAGRADVFESGPQLRRIARGYRAALAWAAERGDPVITIDGRGTAEQVAARIWSAVDCHLRRAARPGSAGERPATRLDQPPAG